MDVQNQLQQAIQQAIFALYQLPPAPVPLQPTRAGFAGTYTFVTFPLTKPARQSPAQIGQAIGDWLMANSALVGGFNVVQGFLNLSLTDAVWLDTLHAMLSDANRGQQPANGQSVMVEFSSPNTNKPLHLGHLRNNFLGDSVSRILAANGYRVIKACLVNDRGIHICKSMRAYQLFGQDTDGQWETPDSSGLKGDHLIGKYYVLFDKAYRQQVAGLTDAGVAKEEAEKKAPLMQDVQQMLRLWEQGDPDTIALWEQLNGWVFSGFAETYKTIGVSFDKTYYESQTYLLGKDVVADGLTTGVFYQKPDNSVWIDLRAEGLDHKLVLRADGTSVYMTQDLGTTDLKFSDFHADRSIWVVGNEQDYHFNVLFAIMARLGRPYAPGCYHLSYGMVDLPSGKMKSREGTVVDADDLVREVTAAAEQAAREAAKGRSDEFSANEKVSLYHMLGLGALKYYLLKVDPAKRMLFDPNESVDLQGHTGPYIQYVHARIRSILRQSPPTDTLDRAEEEMSRTSGLTQTPPSGGLADIERDLIFLLAQYPQRLAQAGADYAPSYLAQYAYDLAKAFNQFYDQLTVLKEPDAAKRTLRLRLSALVAGTIQHAMNLLGIEVPEQM
jgi:arginyl-tRNA synthetase